MADPKPLQECLLMLSVFRGCMMTRTLPAPDSQCSRKVCELLARHDPAGEFAPDDFAAGGGTDGQAINPRMRAGRPLSHGELKTEN